METPDIHLPALPFIDIELTVPEVEVSGEALWWW